MGVLRLTADAVADSSGSSVLAAVARGRRLISEGADIVEICCEPSNLELPAANTPMAAKRVAEVVSALSDEVRVAVACGSLAPASAAVAAGATLIVDHSPYLPLPSATNGCGSLASLAAEAGVGWVAVHAVTTALAAEPAEETHSVQVVLESLMARAEAAQAAGVREIYLDPGIGTGRGITEDLDLLGGLSQLSALGYPLVIGVADGRLIQELHDAADTQQSVEPQPSDEHLEGSLVVAVWAMLAGAAILRAQHMAATVQAARIVGTKQPLGMP